MGLVRSLLRKASLSQTAQAGSVSVIPATSEQIHLHHARILLSQIESDGVFLFAHPLLAAICSKALVIVFIGQVNGLNAGILLVTPRTRFSYSHVHPSGDGDKRLSSS